MLKRRILSGVATAALLIGGGATTPALAAPTPTGPELGDITGVPALVETSADKRIAAWQNLQFGLFMHWGVYSMYEGKYNGKEQRIGYPEQIFAWTETMGEKKMTQEEYLQMAATMRADQWDPAKICKTAKDAGMKYVMITSKHHDGFAMWDTKTTDYNVVKQTAFGKDPLKQLSEECAKVDIKLAFYFSIIDWTQHEPEPWGNQNPITDEHVQYNLDQITELLTNYGPIAEFWFDMGGPTPEQSERMAAKVHEFQPETTVVNSRVWNNKGDFNVGGDNAVHGDFSIGPWESIRSIFPQCWGYCSTYKANRDPANVVPNAKSAVDNLVSVISSDGNFAFNIGPKGDGSFDPFDQQVMDKIAQWHTRHPRAIDGARATWFAKPDWGSITGTRDALYLFPTTWKDGQKLTLKGLNTAVTGVTVDGTARSLDYEQNGLDLSVTLSGDDPDELRPVIKVGLESEPTIVPPQAVALTRGGGDVSDRSIIARETGASGKTSAYDAYVYDRAGATYKDVEIDLSTAKGLDDRTMYRVSFGDRSHEFTGAALKAGPVSGFALEPNKVHRFRIQLAAPSYYADPIPVTIRSIGIQGYENGTVDTAPAFTVHPEDTMTAEGQRVTFTASATGYPRPAYQWYSVDASGAKKAIEGANSTSYTFIADKSQNLTTFFVEATNRVGAATSNGAVLTVTDPLVNLALDKAARQSSDGWWGGVASRANDGNADGVWDNGSVSGTQPEENPWWEVDLGTTRRIGRVNIHNRAESDICSGQSCADRLHDFYVVADSDRIPDDISVEELEDNAESGDELEHSMKVIKLVGRGGYPSTVDFAGHEARYVRVLLPGEHVELNLAEVEVFQAMTAPSVEVSAVGDPEGDFELSDGVAKTKPGTKVVFTASASGFPAPTFQWQKKTGDGEWTNIAGETSQAYTMTASIADDGSRIRVVATNAAGSAESGPIEFSVSVKPTVSQITASVAGTVIEHADDGAWQKVTVDMGTLVELKAEATGHPTPSLAWQSRPVSGTEEQWSDIEGQTGSTMTVTASAEVQDLLYRLVATSTAGTAESAPLRVVMKQSAPPAPGPDPAPEPKIELNADAIGVGDELVVNVTGLIPGDGVAAVVHSEPITIGRTVAASDGTASFTWRVPADFEVGVHRLIVRGDKSGSVERALEIKAASTPQTPRPAPGAEPRPQRPGATTPAHSAASNRLASTGSDATVLIEMTGLLALVGAAALSIRRRRG